MFKRLKFNDKKVIGDIETNKAAYTNLDNKQYIYPEDFASAGLYCDGINDDGQAIKAAHEYANAINKPVKYMDGRTYYILGTTNIPVKTSTDWGSSTIIINDNLGEYNQPIYEVLSNNDKIVIDSDIINSVKNKVLTTTQKLTELAGNGKCLVKVINSDKKQFIRSGVNADIGFDQIDLFVIDNFGNIENQIIWDFDNVTGIELYPIDRYILTLKGGMFKSYTNTYTPAYSYMYKNIKITRSNTIVENLTHTLLDNNVGRPYRGFIYTDNCYNIVVRNCLVSPRKYTTYNGIMMGTYSLEFNRTVSLTLQNMEAFDTNTENWGAFVGNYLKDVKVINSELNRVDAHKGVWNLTIKDSKIGQQGLQLGGGGKLVIENTTVYHPYFVTLRQDYGSTWNGDIFIRDVSHTPVFTDKATKIFHINNDGTHNYGYPCRFGKNIVSVENYFLDNSNGNDYGFYLLNPALGSKTDNTIPPNPYYFAKKYKFKNIKMKDVANGFYVINDSIHRYLTESLYQYEELSTISSSDKLLKIKENIEFEIDDIQLYPIDAATTAYDTSNIIKSINLGNAANDTYLSESLRIIPKFVIKNCKNLFACVKGIPCIMEIDNCTVLRLVGVTSGTRSIAYVNNCVFKPELNTSVEMVRINPSMYFFTNCIFYSPVLNGVSLTTETQIKQIYEFLGSLVPKSSGQYIQFLGKFINCILDSRIDLNSITSQLSFIYDFKFGNNNNDLMPAKIGATSLKPIDIQSSLPVGFRFRDTTTSTWSTWNGTSWD